MGSVLIASFSWILHLFAAFLLVTGSRMLRQRNAHIDPADPGRWPGSSAGCR